MNFTPVVDALKKYSPVLGTLISTANPIAGVIFSAIATAVGGNPANVNDVAQKISNDPDIEVKLQQIELQFAQVDSQNYIAELSDVANARDRDEKIVGEASDKDASITVSLIAVIPHVITFLTGFGILLVVILRMFDHTPNMNDTFLTMIVGQLLIIFNKQCKFYYGAMKNEKE